MGNLQFSLLLPFLIILSVANPANAKTKHYGKKPKKELIKTYGLSGQFILKDSIEGGDLSFNSNVTWKPDNKNYWYITARAKYNFENNNEGFRYNWGMGYDNWREGTWTVQLNNYESLKPGDGLDIDSAVASIGYKTKLKFLKDNNLKSTITLSKRLDGDPKLSTSLQWSPKKYWFLKGILVVPLEGDEPYWNYLFGYDDWHPNTFGFEYTNYESNPIGESNFEKGRIALNYKWKYK